MATVKRNRISRIHPNVSKPDFSKVGGLTSHVKLLREIIILPLLYGNLYHHFNIKAPRGVIFYGPPGTGKTLVAGALANELNKEGNGKVTFFQRKGADILDKWVGESERKLREMFEKAIRCRPTVIFFDELDGLAPERSIKNDQVHSSVVATLLALMDGLDNMTGVIVIGATNRIDSIDPALRRPGRFDRELYFPLPSLVSRKEILQVHTKCWKHKPTCDFLTHLAELTSGCCGSDLQALCAEAVLCCLKRRYPMISQKNNINIEVETLKVEQQDFLAARMNIVPTSQRLGNSRMRRLSTYIQPLLQRQLNKIMRHIEVLLPHFTQTCRKFLVGSDRYAGRLLLKGSIQQGLNVHIIPAILQSLEHLQSYVLDIPSQFKKIITKAVSNLPSILVLSRVDEWWNILENVCQLSILSMLDNIHAGLPILLIATCGKDLPLENHFYYNSSIVIPVDDPTAEEREQFFAPLFFSNTIVSVYSIWQNENVQQIKKDIDDDPADKKVGAIKGRVTYIKNLGGAKRAIKQSKSGPTSRNGKKGKMHQVKIGRVSKRSKEVAGKSLVYCSLGALQECCKTALNYAKKTFGLADFVAGKGSPKSTRRRCRKSARLSEENPNKNTSTAVTDLVNCRDIMHSSKNLKGSQGTVETIYLNKTIKQEPTSQCVIALVQNNEADRNVDRTDTNIDDIYCLWKRVSNITSEGLPVVQLELLYDTILACIYVNKNCFSEVITGLEKSLDNFENACGRSSYDC